MFVLICNKCWAWSYALKIVCHDAIITYVGSNLYCDFELENNAVGENYVTSFIMYV